MKVPTASETPAPSLSWEPSSPHRRKRPVVRASGLLQPAEGPGKGIRLGACFPHRNPVANDPSAVREELEKRLIITPPSSPGHPGPGPGLWERSGEHAEAEAETQGVSAGNRPRPGPGGGVQLGVEVAPGPGHLLRGTLGRHAAGRGRAWDRGPARSTELYNHRLGSPEHHLPPCPSR